MDNQELFEQLAEGWQDDQTRLPCSAWISVKSQRLINKGGNTLIQIRLRRGFYA